MLYTLFNISDRHNEVIYNVKRLLVLPIMLVLGALLALPASASTSYPVSTDALLAYATGFSQPAAAPPGANVPGCRLSPEHRQPVILVNGFLGNQSEEWQGVAPFLANQGFCVYTFNYGGSSQSSLIQGVAPTQDDAAELGTEVQQVKAQTGASQVDIVSHSFGGLVSLYYMAADGGARYVKNFVGLAPPSHGTTAGGIVTFLQSVELFSPFNQIFEQVFPGCGSCEDIIAGSTFLTQFAAAGEVAPGPHYTILISKDDEAVTPVDSAFLTGPNVTNMFVQTSCPDDQVGHVGLTYDTWVFQTTANILSPATAAPATCTQGLGL